jgi:hypothetical protein
MLASYTYIHHSIRDEPPRNPGKRKPCNAGKLHRSRRVKEKNKTKTFVKSENKNRGQGLAKYSKAISFDGLFIRGSHTQH